MVGSGNIIGDIKFHPVHPHWKRLNNQRFAITLFWFCNMICMWSSIPRLLRVCIIPQVAGNKLLQSMLLVAVIVLPARENVLAGWQCYRAACKASRVTEPYTDSSMDKWLHPLLSMGWSYISIPKLQRLHRWSLGMDKSFHPTLYWAYDHLSMMGLKLIPVNKRAPWRYCWCHLEYGNPVWWEYFHNNETSLDKLFTIFVNRKNSKR